MSVRSGQQVRPLSRLSMCSARSDESQQSRPVSRLSCNHSRPCSRLSVKSERPHSRSSMKSDKSASRSSVHTLDGCAGVISRPATLPTEYDNLKSGSSCVSNRMIGSTEEISPSLVPACSIKCPKPASSVAVHPPVRSDFREISSNGDEKCVNKKPLFMEGAYDGKSPQSLLF